MGLVSPKGDRRQVPLEIRLTYPTNSEHGRRACLRIVCASSSIEVLEVDLDAEAFLALMGNSGAYGVAEMASVKHLARVGKIMEVGSEVWSSTVYGNQLAAEHDAEQWRKDGGWDTVDVRRNNSHNWAITGRRWVDPQ